MATYIVARHVHHVEAALKNIPTLKTSSPRKWKEKHIKTNQIY